jgi:hypothetical protein
MRGSRQRKPRPRTHKVDRERDSLVVVRAAVGAAITRRANPRGDSVSVKRDDEAWSMTSAVAS